MDVKELREITGMSQQKFGEYLGLSVRTYKGWEYGRSAPQGVVEMMERILRHEGFMEQRLTAQQMKEINQPVWRAYDAQTESGGYWCLCIYGDIITPSEERYAAEDVSDWEFYLRKPAKR